MTTLINKFKQISELKPRRRGIQFERLFYEVFERENILLEGSYFNEDGSQQIDGAIEINNRIFLTEIKWEESKTLAASKLYSFLGKINSKIDGTLGLFISYNELGDNFLNSVRAGLRQNCIIINGEDNIIPIVNGEVRLKDYIWYIYQQASTRNRIFIPVSEFISFPKKSDENKDDSKWNEVYEALISDEDNGDFEVKLDSNYSEIDNLPEKTITLYPILHKNKTIANKLNYLVDTVIDKDKSAFYRALVAKLDSLHWIKYADENLLDKSKNLSTIDQEQADNIALKVIEYLREYYGVWEEENKASLVLDFLFDHVSEEVMCKIYYAYAPIYCDTARKSHYPQKKFADKLFKQIEPGERFKVIKKEIEELIGEYKEEEKIFSEDTAEANKKYVIRRIKQKFDRIIEESEVKNINKKLERMYDKA
jgi:hypothetical protein